jgi:hypothetical protein
MGRIAGKKRAKILATHFASVERSEKSELYRQIDTISIDGVIIELLKIELGLLAVLNSNRQIITVNRNFLESFQIENSADLLGLRPGEAINCDYAQIMEAGCGTSKYCRTCGAAIAIVIALNDKKTNERKCIISAKKDGKKFDYHFKVKASPFNIDGENFILLFMHDITSEHQLEYLEKAFFYDLTNIIADLENNLSLIENKSQEEQIVSLRKIKKISQRLSQEIKLHKLLLKNEIDGYNVNFESYSINQLIQEMMDFVSLHKSINLNKLEILNETIPLTIETDLILLSRVIINMLINAFEEHQHLDKVKLIFESDDNSLIIKVRNKGIISPDIALRIFQKNFTTKVGIGRGFGTYSMKLIGEKLLKGTITFNSSEKEQTVFEVKIPRIK